MPVTKLSTERAAQELQEARQHHEALRGRIAAGDTKLSGADIAEAEGRLRLAALRTEAAEQHETEQQEQARLARIEQIRESLVTSDHHRQTADVVKAFDTAVAALEELRRAARTQGDHLAALVRELYRLRPMPDDVDLPARPMPGHVEVTVGDQTYRVWKDTPELLVLEAVEQVLGRGAIKPPAPSHRIDRLRRLVESEEE